MKFLTILLMCTLSGAEVDLFIPSFPELQNLFNLTPFMVEFTLGANFCAYCLGSLLAGNLGDRFGRKPVILSGCIIFILGSLLCILAPNFSVLIIGRILQGFGIAGPAVLAYVVIADTYPADEQPRLLGILNGMITLAMAFAPVIGSYVNLFFNWQGNFVILLIMGILSLLMGMLWIPDYVSHNLDEKISLSIKTYLPIIRSKPALGYIMAITFSIVPYWIFIGMAPIFYMESLEIPLKFFGYYQGALAGVFSIVSLYSGRLLKRFGQKACVIWGMILCCISIVVLMILGMTSSRSPLMITGAMLILSAGIVFPVHIFYPHSLELIKGAKGRMAAIILSVRLLLTAVGLEIVSYYYQGGFNIISYAMCLCLTIGVFFMYWILRKHLTLPN